MAREPMTERLPQLRVTKKMGRWVERFAEQCRVSVADVQREALRRMMEKRERPVLLACSCSPDDRAKDGCRCGAEVGR